MKALIYILRALRAGCGCERCARYHVKMLVASLISLTAMVYFFVKALISCGQ